MAKRRSEWTEDELDEMLASAGRGVEAISRSERFAFAKQLILDISQNCLSSLRLSKIWVKTPSFYDGFS
ncbi:MAG: hypothetical protein ACKPJN_02060 [Microcystis panniformis]